MTDDRIASLRSTAHPLRLRMLSLLTGSAMSAAELARELDVSHANASYHLRILAEAGEVVVDSEEKIRGGVAKRYRHPWEQGFQRSQDPSDTFDPTGSSPPVRAMTIELLRRFEQRTQPSRTFLCDAELWVDPETWERAMALVREAASVVHAEARKPHSDGSVHVNLTMAAFAMQDGPRAPTQEDR